MSHELVVSIVGLWNPLLKLTGELLQFQEIIFGKYLLIKRIAEFRPLKSKVTSRLVKAIKRGIKGNSLFY
jgi:hypothetical protein